MSLISQQFIKCLNIAFCCTIFLPILLTTAKQIDFNNNNNNVLNIDNGIKNSNINTNTIGGTVVAADDTNNHGFLMDLLSNAFRLLNLRKVVKELHSGKPSTGTSACMSCKFGFAMAQHLIQFGKDKEELGSIANYLCTTLDLASGRVCDGMVDQLKDELVQIISRINFSPNEICGSLLGESCAKVYNPLYNWTLPLTPIAKPVLKSSAQRSQPKSSSPKLRVLHLSDTHVDPLYVEGGDAVCGEPLCCRNASSSSSSAINMQNRAGFWGDYRDCDIPLRTLEQTLKFIESTHQDIDYIIWTGDIPPHDVWNQSRDGQLSIIKLVAKTVHKYLGNIPIYPALGNHESAPINSFPTPNIQGVHSISWLYSALEDIWSQWLPSHTLPLIKNGAYYAVMVKPGLKLISLNMNYCNNQNWWLLLNATDPAGQLQWLIRELQASELIGEKVHIIGHIPPGSDDCLQIWSRNMNRIVNRFEDTITGQFYGHTHQDEVEIFYETTRDAKNKNGVHIRPTNMAYIGPSVTTFGNVNPGYRIYTIDGDYDESTYEVLDYETYYLNLTEANINRDSKPLEYRLSYTAQQALGLQDLTPDSWHKLLLKMKNDTQLFNKFYEYFYNKSDNIGDNVCTSRQCRREILCRLMKAIAHDNYICNKFL